MASLMVMVGCATSPERKKPSPTLQKKVVTPAQRDSAKIWYSVGKDYLKKKNLDAALSNFKKALSYDPNFIQIYLDMGWVYLQKHQFDSAEVAYRKVAEINPKDSRGWQGLGFMYGILKRNVQNGLKYYEKALKVDPENNDARYGMAELLASVGRISEADSLYKKALETDPENMAIIKSYSLFLSKHERYADAIPYLEKAIQHFKSDEELHRSLMNAYIKTGGENIDILSKALSHINFLLNKHPNDYSLWTKKADILYRMGKVNEAIAAYDSAKLRAPDNPIPYLKEASVVFEAKKDIKKSRALLNKALQMKFPGDEYKAATYALLGDTYVKSGKLTAKDGDDLRQEGLEKDAREAYKEAVNLYEKAIGEYQKGKALSAGKWSDYCTKQIKRITKIKQKVWRKSQGIE